MLTGNSVARWIKYAFRRQEEPRKKLTPLKEIHAHWLEDQKAERYADASPERSQFLVRQIGEHVPRSASIIEIGCNAGRNLHYLHRAGYENLSAIEINPRAVEVLRRRFPELVTVPIRISPVEAAARTWRRNQFDLMFTMAVLLHIHPRSDWVFARMARASKMVFTIEAENAVHWHIFPRNYQEIFESLGAVQVAEYREVDGLPAYTGRLFDTSRVR